MTTKQTEAISTTRALKQALEALELHGQQYPHMVKGYCLDAITAIRAALASKSEALAEQPEGCQCPACKIAPHASNCAVHNEPAYPNGACNCRAQPVQEPVAYDKTELNCFAQDLYDKKMREGKHGHYESMFHVIHQCIKKVAPPANKPLTDEEIDNLPWGPHEGNPMTFAEGLRDFARAIEAKLKEKNA